MIKQNFTVQPNGLIESGTVQVTIDEKTGLIDFSEVITAGIGPFSETDQHSSAAKIDPAMLMSKNVQLNQRFQMGPVVLQVTALDPVKHTAQLVVAVDSGDIELSGGADLDLVGPYIALDSIHLEGTVSGHDVILQLDPA